MKIRPIFITVSIIAIIISTPLSIAQIHEIATNKRESPYIIPKRKDVLTSIGKTSRKVLDPRNITILVWNMYKGMNESWQRDYLFLTHNKDLLILQEMFLNQNMQSIFSQHEHYKYNLTTSFIFRKNGFRTGITTAAQVPATKIRFQRSFKREPIIKTPKMVMTTTYNIEGMKKKLLVANIHAINIVGPIFFIHQVNKVLKLILRHNGPVIFAGDFNTWSKDRYNYLQWITNLLGLKEVKFKNDTRMRALGYPLDYIFIRGMRAKSSNVWGDLAGSDHKALEAELEIIIP